MRYEHAPHMLQAISENRWSDLKVRTVGVFAEVIVAIFHLPVPSSAKGGSNNPKRREVQDAQITNGSEDSSEHELSRPQFGELSRIT
jgi:hypothetical protein